MTTARPSTRTLLSAGLTFLVLGSAVCACGGKRKWEVAHRAGVYRELTEALWCHAEAHNGTFPGSLESLAQDVIQKGYDFRTAREWPSFIYVANLTTNDPECVPIVMSDPTSDEGVMILLNAANAYYSAYPQSTRIAFSKKPWLLAEMQGVDEGKVGELANRIRVIWPPAGAAEARAKRSP